MTPGLLKKWETGLRVPRLACPTVQLVGNFPLLDEPDEPAAAPGSFFNRLLDGSGCRAFSSGRSWLAGLLRRSEFTPHGEGAKRKTWSQFHGGIAAPHVGSESRRAD